jgi:HK97 family phage prohead protease
MPSTGVALKSLTDTTATIEGYAVVWGGSDLEGEHFSKQTNFWPEAMPAAPVVLYEHGLDPTIGRTVLGHVVVKTVDDVGLWVQAQIDRSRAYAAHILELVKTGRLGWSTGAVSHLVEKANGFIRSWPLVECSLTPTPCEPRTLGARLAAKSITARLPSDVISAAQSVAQAEYEKFTALTAEMDARAAATAAARRAEILALKGDFDDIERQTDAGSTGVVVRVVNPYDVPDPLKTTAAATVKAVRVDLGLPPVAIQWWREETAGDRALKADARRVLGREPWPASVKDRRILGWISPDRPTEINVKLKPNHDPRQLRTTVRHELRHVRQALDGLCSGVSDYCQRAELERDADEYAAR